MKYKLLLAGNNKRVISEFFYQLDFSFECMSSSIIFDDLKNHMNYFKPDLFLFCMNTESRDDIITIANFHNELFKNEIPYAAVGDAGELDFAAKIPGAMPELTLKGGISTSDLGDEITRYIQKYKTKSSYASLSSQPQAPIVSTDTILQKATTDTGKIDLMAQIDAELNAMEKVGGKPGATPAFNPAAIQPETPGRHRILVIDDATIVHKAIKGYLDAEYEVATAISGKIALRYLQAKEVSLILLDYEMPEMNGPAVLTKLRENPFLASIPVVFLTGINDVEKIKNALALKPQGYLLKPVDKKALIDKIHELVI